MGEVARRLRLSPVTVYRAISDGRLDAVRLGGGNGPLRVPAQALDEYARPARERSGGLVEA